VSEVVHLRKRQSALKKRAAQRGRGRTAHPCAPGRPAYDSRQHHRRRRPQPSHSHCTYHNEATLISTTAAQVIQTDPKETRAAQERENKPALDHAKRGYAVCPAPAASSPATAAPAPAVTASSAAGTYVCESYCCTEPGGSDTRCLGTESRAGIRSD